MNEIDLPKNTLKQWIDILCCIKISKAFKKNKTNFLDASYSRFLKQS